MNVRYALVWSGCETEDLVHEGALSGDVVSRLSGHLSLGQHGLKPSMGRVRRLISRLSLHEVAALAAPEPNYADLYDFGGAADRGKTTGDDGGGGRASPSRPAPTGPTISRAPRA